MLGKGCVESDSESVSLMHSGHLDNGGKSVLKLSEVRESSQEVTEGAFKGTADARVWKCGRKG
jgi:hypothetical protein